jgi:hypothetical protein
VWIKEEAMKKHFKAARRAAVPIIAIETADQQNTAREISLCYTTVPIIQWDVIRGISPVNPLGRVVVNELCSGEDPAMATSNPAEMLIKATEVPEKTIVLMNNAHRFIDNEVVSQGLCNLRDIYKTRGATLVLLAPAIRLPSELEQDVMIITEKLPDESEIRKIVLGVTEDAGVEKMEEKTVVKISDTLIGLSSFCAEQTLATCLEKNEEGEVVINRELLWERKCKAVEQTPGLSIWRGKESFEDIGGCDNIKDFINAIIKGKDSPRAIVFMDEIEKAFAGSSSDSSGVSQDQLGAILSFMQDKEVDGMIFVGPPGAAKSAVAKAAGNSGGVPTISFDLGAMKNSLVGKSEEQTRKSLNIIEAISRGRVLFIATCNSITSLPPELRRRFTMGTFFFDLPSEEDRKKIWDIYLKKYGVECELPEDKDWTGAEIKQCAKLASKLGMSLKEASSYIVPVAKSASEQIASLRRLASGKFIDSNRKGIYSDVSFQEIKTPTRKFEE